MVTVKCLVKERMSALRFPFNSELYYRVYAADVDVAGTNFGFCQGNANIVDVSDPN